MSCSGSCWGHLISEGSVLHLDRIKTTIGRSCENDIVLEDPSNFKMVSSQHIVLLRIGSSAILIDTSLNGTYLNSRRIRKAVLRPNDVIRLGKKRSVCGNTKTYLFVFTASTTLAPTIPYSVPLNLREEVRSSLRCPMCSDFLCFPTEVTPCSHLFCSTCIEAYTRQNASNSCFQCGAEVTSFKCQTKYNFVNIIEKALKMVLTESEYSDYQQKSSMRKQELLDRNRTLSLLKEKHESIEYSPRTGDPFLLVCQTWSEYEKHKFMKGIAKHPYGESRQFYCWMVRLTDEWIRRDANLTDLSVALRNLDLLQGSTEFSEEEARDALYRFLYGKQQLA
jgi:hypothetical protein